MVIRKCLVYNLDLFAVQGKLCNCKQSCCCKRACMKILKWKKIYCLNVYLPYFYFSFYLLLSCFILTAVCTTNLKERYKFSRQHQKCTSWAICQSRELWTTPHKRPFHLPCGCNIQMKWCVGKSLIPILIGI